MELPEETISEINAIVPDSEECCAGCHTIGRVVDFFELMGNISPQDFVGTLGDTHIIDFFLECGEAIDWINLARTTMVGRMLGDGDDEWDDEESE